MPEITEIPQIEKKSLLEDLSVPSVRERDPDPQSGPRLNVKKFKLEGIVEYPELGITRQDLDTLIENIRAELMQDYKVLKSGFTKSEIEQVTKLVGEIEEKTTDRHVNELDLQKLVWLVREQRSNRGITLGTIETVADRITRFYRERGFILAKAYIPKQEVRDGVVTLTLLLGILGETSVTGNELYDSDYLVSVFDNMLDKPVTSAVTEENIYLINDFPGLQASGFFQPGSQVGDTRINIDVKSEKRYESHFRYDNHGSEQTGKNRFYADLLINNLAGYADQLDVQALITTQPDNSTYGQMRYSSRVFNPRLSLSAGLSSNDFVLGDGNNENINQLDVEGSTRQADLTTTYRLKRSRTRNDYFDVKMEQIQSSIQQTSIKDVDLALDDTLNNLVISWRFDLLDETRKILHQGNIGLTSGTFVKGQERGQNKNYNILNLNYSLLTFWNVPLLDTSSRIIYRSTLQYTPAGLSSISQYSLGGASRASAYPSNQFSADTAIYMGVNWIFDSLQWMDMDLGPVNLRNNLHPLLFMDISAGEAYALTDEKQDSTALLMDAGLGLEFSYKNDLKANLKISIPLQENFSSEDVSIADDKFRILFDIQYLFL